MPHLTPAGCSQGFGRDIGLQAKEEPASRSQDPSVNADMLSDRVHIPECPLKWAGGIKRRCSTYEVGEIDGLHGRGNSMPIGQTDLGPLTSLHLVSLQSPVPALAGDVEQERPRGVDQDMRYRQMRLCIRIFSYGLSGSFMSLFAGEIDQHLYRATSNAESHCSQPGGDAGRVRKLVARSRQDDGVGEERGVACRHKEIVYYNVVAASAPQPTGRPRVDDLARSCGAQHEPEFWGAG